MLEAGLEAGSDGEDDAREFSKYRGKIKLCTCTMDSSVQYATGHGYFVVYLNKHGPKDTTACECGVERQTPEYMILECERDSDDMTEMLGAADRP